MWVRLCGFPAVPLLGRIKHTACATSPSASAWGLHQRAYRDRGMVAEEDSIPDKTVIMLHMFSSPRFCPWSAISATAVAGAAPDASSSPSNGNTKIHKQSLVDGL